LHPGENPILHLRQLVRRVIAEPMPARLRLQQHREGGIAADIDPLDRVHLHGDIQRHHAPVQNLRAYPQLRTRG
jgi:hypothetical protein